jgi:hypothetical protein
MTSPQAPPEPWSDARLDEAFRTAFNGGPPVGLAGRVGARVHVTPRGISGFWPSLRQLGAVSVIAFALAVIVVGMQLRDLGPRPSVAGPSRSSTPGPTSATAQATRSPASRLPWPFPDQVSSGHASYEVNTVAEALEIRTADPTDRTIAVAGWESYARQARFCTIALPGILGQLENQCVYNRWLASVAEPDTSWYDPPITPAFRFAWDPGLTPDAIRFAGGSFPRGSHTAQVLVGHFHDALADQCNAEDRVSCSSVFVVTDVAWTLTAATFTLPPAGTSMTPMTVEEAVGVRDNGDRLDAAELAVGGWFERNIVPCRGPLGSAQIPLEDCSNDFTWLMSGPEVLDVEASDGSGSIHPPRGPALSLVLGDLAIGQTSQPVHRMAIGHFRDARAADCPAGDRRTACEGRFVVDILLAIPPPSAEPTATP